MNLNQLPSAFVNWRGFERTSTKVKEARRQLSITRSWIVAHNNESGKGHESRVELSTPSRKIAADFQCCPIWIDKGKALNAESASLKRSQIKINFSHNFHSQMLHSNRNPSIDLNEYLRSKSRLANESFVDKGTFNIIIDEYFSLVISSEIQKSSEEKSPKMIAQFNQTTVDIYWWKDFITRRKTSLMISLSATHEWQINWLVVGRDSYWWVSRSCELWLVSTLAFPFLELVSSCFVHFVLIAFLHSLLQWNWSSYSC